MATVAQIQQAVQRAITAWETLINATGVDTDFLLHDTGVLATNVKTVRRKKPDENLTEGVQQQGFEIQFLYKHWASKAPAGRHPEKGDRIAVLDRHHMIEGCKLVEYANIPIGYVARVLG